MFLRNQIKIALIIISFSIGCAAVSGIRKSANIENILQKNPLSWNIDDCDVIEEYFSRRNYKILNNNEGQFKISNDNVLIKAIPLNENVLRAKVRKRMIFQRIEEKYFKKILHEEFNRYLYLNVDTSGSVLRKLDKNSITYSFEIIFENNSEPYHPIEVENGFSCIFLENEEGNFGRVVEAEGEYISENIIITDYYRAIVKFNSKDDNGKFLFSNNKQSYRLVFNGFQNKPVILEWK